MINRINELSAEDLADLAVDLGLIDRYSLGGSQVVIVSDERTFRFPRAEASIFLRGMLTAWRRHQYLGKKAEVDEVDYVLSSGEGSAGAAEGPRSLDLNELLSQAEKQGVIKGFEKKPLTGDVTLILEACECRMTYPEASHFLADCLEIDRPADVSWSEEEPHRRPSLVGTRPFADAQGGFWLL